MLSISTEYEGGSLHIALTGEFDHHAAARALELSRCALDRFLPRTCGLDLSALSFMDSSGIAFILRMKKILSSMGSDFYLICPSGQPGRVIDASGIQRLVRLQHPEKERETNEVY